MKTSNILIIVILLGALVAGGFFYFHDTEIPRITLSPAGGAVSAKRPLSLEMEDTGSGLKSALVVAVQGEKTFQLWAGQYEPGTYSRKEALDLSGAALTDGPFELRVTVTDGSVYHFGAGNTAQQAFAFEYDSKAPVISVLSTAHNLNQGGAGLIIYSLSEEAEKTGVLVGDFFFPGHLQETGAYACLFALPYNMPLKEFSPKLIAVDRAGNERQTGFYYHANPRTFPKSRINLGLPFLETIEPRFESLFPKAGSPLELFLSVNRDLRQKNRGTLRDLAGQTSPRPLWEGPFLRQPNAATRGGFAAARTYYYEGKKVDEQTHLGIDLASVAQAPVPAANAGRVVHADYLGIYGQCVIIDHGLGLQSLYGHLSRIDVTAGEQVSKGQIIARTGATGLAGGDHLHFGIILSGLPVNPIEWWDPSWIMNNVSKKLGLSISR